MDHYTNRQWWAEVADRAIRTAAQVAVALAGTDAVGITSVDWPGVASAAALAAVLSVFTSLAAGRLGDTTTPSLRRAPTPPAAPEPVPTYQPVTGDANAIVPPGTSTAYRIPPNPTDILG